jgi:hypothetical protein
MRFKNSLATADSMLRHFAAPSPATGGFRGNDRKVNLQERSYE